MFGCCLTCLSFDMFDFQCLNTITHDKSVLSGRFWAVNVGDVFIYDKQTVCYERPFGRMTFLPEFRLSFSPLAFFCYFGEESIPVSES